MPGAYKSCQTNQMLVILRMEVLVVLLVLPLLLTLLEQAQQELLADQPELEALELEEKQVLLQEEEEDYK